MSGQDSRELFYLGGVFLKEVETDTCSRRERATCVDLRRDFGYTLDKETPMTDRQNPDTYINIPVTDAEAAAIRETDQAWNGPKLIALLLATLGFAFFVLWANSQHLLVSMDNERDDFAPGALTGH